MSFISGTELVINQILIVNLNDNVLRKLYWFGRLDANIINSLVGGHQTAYSLLSL